MTPVFPTKVYNLPFVPGSDHLYFRFDFPKYTSYEQIGFYCNTVIKKIPLFNRDRTGVCVRKHTMLINVHGKGIRNLYFSKNAEKLRERIKLLFFYAFVDKEPVVEFDEQILLNLMKICKLGCCSCSQEKKEA